MARQRVRPDDMATRPPAGQLQFRSKLKTQTKGLSHGDNCEPPLTRYTEPEAKGTCWLPHRPSQRVQWYSERG